MNPRPGKRPGIVLKCSLDPQFVFFKCSSKVRKNDGKFDRTSAIMYICYHVVLVRCFEFSSSLGLV